ncbi:MAG: hypothetical protein AAAC48_18590 [Phyllobacterium sp.]|jgi:hypothetical protein|uniref:hypothetical protein n=1 Tax=Phyllobacterium sp. TaxID=1871046 RepID=UPI0030F0ADF6
MLRKLSMVAVTGLMTLSVAACTTNERRVAGYGAGGAALGALAGGAITGSGRGALTGAAIGAGTGVVVGAATANNDRRYCTFENRFGQRYRAPCRR